jgi:hypothetical protein
MSMSRARQLVIYGVALVGLVVVAPIIWMEVGNRYATCERIGGQPKLPWPSEWRQCEKSDDCTWIALCPSNQVGEELFASINKKREEQAASSRYRCTFLGTSFLLARRIGYCMVTDAGPEKEVTCANGICVPETSDAIFM